MSPENDQVDVALFDGSFEMGEDVSLFDSSIRRYAGEICQQLKDPARNGGRNLALVHEHVANDDLVGWAWQPGPGRQPAPGDQKQLGDLVQAWIDSGAECP